MERTFEYNARPGRVVFAVGSWRQVQAEVERLGRGKVMIVASGGRRAMAEEQAGWLGARCVGIFAEAEAHVPHHQVEAARAMARESGADCVIALGGGAPVGIGKLVAYTEPVSVIAVPTTYAGSEMTNIAGVTKDGRKTGVVDDRLLPATVIYDPALTVGLSPYHTATTGMNAFAHCVEAMYVPQANPVTDMLAEAGIVALANGLPAAVAAPDDLGARSEVLYGAYLAGAAIGATGIALHHRICHVLGGTYGLGHGDANSVILPYVLRYNEAAAPRVAAAVARALGGDDGAGDVFDFVSSLGAPTALKDLGLAGDALDDVAEHAVATTAGNPRPPQIAEVRALLDNAFHGRRP